SPLMTLAAVVFVVAVGGFALTTYRRFRAQQAENVRHEIARSRRRTNRRPSASRISRARTASTTETADQRRASSLRAADGVELEGLVEALQRAPTGSIE